MTVAAADGSVAYYDVTFDAWVIDLIKPSGAAVSESILPEYVRDDSENNREGGDGSGSGTCSVAGCTALPVKQVLVSVRRRLAQCGEVARAGRSSGHDLVGWRGRRGRWSWVPRKKGGKKTRKKKVTPSEAAARCRSLQESSEDRDEKLGEAIGYCKMTMGIARSDLST